MFVVNLPYRSDHRDAMSLAAALTGLDVDYVDGVTEVRDKALPPMSPGLSMDQGGMGAWRAHVNVLRLMVERNIASALIVEDDADWDVRIKEQMNSYARAYPTITDGVEGHGPQNFEVDQHECQTPISSPYGDIHRWDVHWLGHCGTRFPQAGDGNTPLGRAVISNDETVPEKQHAHMQFGNDDLVNEYPPHTRVVSRAAVNTCSLAYGVSRPGARRLLYELGIRKITGPYDLMLRSVCEGSEDRKQRVCLSVQPQLFQHHRAKGSRASYSDIATDHEGFNEQAFTRNVRWSTRLNFEKLLDGEEDYVDLFRDGEPMPELGY